MIHKEFRWLFMFAVLSVGVGLCGGMLAERLLSRPAEASETAPRQSGKFGSPHHRSPLRSVSGLADELSLDDDQRSRVERILSEAAETMRRLEDENRETESKAREAVLDVLTVEQKEKLDRKMERDRDEWRRRELDEEVQGWTAVLDLSDAEAASFRSALAAATKKKDEFFRERCRDGARPEKAEVRAFFDAWRVEKKDALRAALTPEQFAKYEAVEKSDLFDGGR